MSPLDAVNAGNAAFVEQLYEAYKTDANSVDPQWAAFFSGFEFAGPVGQAIAGPGTGVNRRRAAGHAGLGFDPLLSRKLGHLVANLDPLGHNIGHHPLLELSEFGLSAADMDRMR